MKDKKDIKILQKAEYYSSKEYPQFVDFATRQQHSHWLHTEASVENDLHSLLVDMPEASRESIVNVLKLFVTYELRLGANFWAAIGNTFPRAEIQRMGAVFANMEIAVHSPFYAEVNRLLGLDIPAFYMEYKDNQILSDRVQFLDDNCILGKNASVMELLTTLATLSLIEGCVLYSSFALLKSFQANGHNEIPNVVTGVAYVCTDEQIHSEGAAELFHTLLDEAELTAEEKSELSAKINTLANSVVEHELEISNIIFENGDLPSITKSQMEIFIKSRANLVSQMLVGKELVAVEGENIVAQWFYDNINAVTLVDFFNRTATSYTRDWNENKLTW